MHQKGTAPHATRSQVGSGWGTYGQRVLTGDLTDDGRADVFALDGNGVLWLHRAPARQPRPSPA
ncbi:hypothetical protein BU197_01025 [Streptomyces sp. CBMA291]|nr:hypothetical protein [Streptomyces sp. CBMA291]MBD0714306.1 hypothetical protein [Streptomyces sp. CBMA370]